MPPAHPELPLPPDSPWNRLAAAARGPQHPISPPPGTPPPGFTSRVISRWTELRQNETFLLWSRWSLRTALAAAAAAVLVHFLPPAPPAPTLIAPPDVPIPSLPPP